MRVKRSQQSMETEQAFARFSGLARFYSSGSDHTSRCKKTLRCTTLRAALLVFSSFHDFFELGGVLTASSLFITLRGFAFTLVYDIHRDTCLG